MICEGLVSTTFSLFFIGIGALATASACYFFPSVAVNGTHQLMIFSVMSLFSLFLLRPGFLRLIHKETRLDGPEAFIGKRAKV